VIYFQKGKATKAPDIRRRSIIPPVPKRQTSNSEKFTDFERAMAMILMVPANDKIKGRQVVSGLFYDEIESRPYKLISNGLKDDSPG
jgi:hypothetical protein